MSSLCLRGGKNPSRPHALVHEEEAEKTPLYIAAVCIDEHK